MRTLFFLIMALIGCRHKEVDVTDIKEPTVELAKKCQDVVERFPEFLDRGFVVSLYQGTKIHQGDSLLFSGLALYALDCKNGQPIADALMAMLDSLDGGVYRHPDLPEKEPSLDGLLGMYRGITKRINMCGETDQWAKVMTHHNARMAAALPAEFNLVADALGHRLGLNGEPDARRRETLAAEIVAWTELVKARKAACYRVHLGLLALQTMDDLGFPIPAGSRGQFAAATDGLQMPTIDHYSGRDGLEAFLQDFKYNDWQFALQRCEKWEPRDGFDQQHPGVDYLVGYADLFGASK